jgi:hypothetical protein
MASGIKSEGLGVCLRIAGFEMAEASGGRTHRRRGDPPPAGFEDRDDHRTACASRRDRDRYLGCGTILR